MGAEILCGRGALEHSRELGTADSRHHAGGAHRARAHPTLTTSAPAPTRSRTPVRGDHVARDDRDLPVDLPRRPERRQHPLLVPVGGVDDEGVGPGGEHRPGPAGTSPLMPIATATRSRPARRAPGRTGSSGAPRYGSSRPPARRRRGTGAGERVGRRASGRRRRPGPLPRPRSASSTSGSPLITWCTWVKRSTPRQSASVTTPTGAPDVVDHHDGAVRPLGDQVECVGHRVVGRPPRAVSKIG